MVKIYFRVTYSLLFLPFYTETDEAFAGLMSICLVTNDKVLLRYTPERDSKIAKTNRYELKVLILEEIRLFFQISLFNSLLQ